VRQVSARGRPTAKASRSGGRAAPARKADARPESRKASRGDRGGGILGVIRAVDDTPISRRPMLLLTLLLLFVGAVGGLWVGGYFTAARDGMNRATHASLAAMGFGLDRVDVAGNYRTPAAEIYAAMGFNQGQSLFAADPHAAREKLLQLPWVSDAVVRRRFPGTIAVTVFEKRPFAVWQGGDRLEVVERSGAIIPGQNTELFADLPLLIGAGAAEHAAPVLDALGRQRATSARLRGLERVSGRRWDVILDRGVRVRLPESGWANQLLELERLIVDRGVLERDVEIIDLRYPDNYIFQLHNGDSRPVTRERPA
jgi:cell division protein FtsQ